MITIWVEEEYGYRLWRWDFPGTHEELVAEWKAGKAPLNFFDPSKGDYQGTMTQVTDEEFRRGVRESRRAGVIYRAHVHEDDDTVLDVCYRSPHFKDTGDADG